MEAGEKGKSHLGLKHNETLCNFCDSDSDNKRVGGQKVGIIAY